MAEGVSLVGVVDVTHLSTSGMNLYIEVDNDTCHRLVVSRAEIDVVEDGENVVTISLRDKVVIPRRAKSEILLPLRFKSRSSFALGRLLWRVIDGRGDDITLSYRMRAGLRLIKRNITAENIALSDLLGKEPTMMNAIEMLWEMVK
jgi:hypothetical protein